MNKLDDQVSIETFIQSIISLADNYKCQKIDGYFMSEKLDGQRALFYNGNFYTRTGKLIYAPDFFKYGLPVTKSVVFDGELFLSRGEFQKLQTIVRRQDYGGDWQNVKFAVFDNPLAIGGVETRIATLKDYVEKHQFSYLVKQERCRNAAHIQEMMEGIVETEGWEGLMLRNPIATFRNGRSCDILKVKSFEDDEAVVMAMEEGKGKHIGKIGSLVCEFVKDRNKKFKVGSGFTDVQRELSFDSCYLNKIITVKFFEKTKDGLPRFPTFKGFRENGS